MSVSQIKYSKVRSARGGDLILYGRKGYISEQDVCIDDSVKKVLELGGHVIIRSPEGDDLVTILPTGIVQFGEKFDESVAVRSFWAALGLERVFYK